MMSTRWPAHVKRTGVTERSGYPGRGKTEPIMARAMGRQAAIPTKTKKPNQETGYRAWPGPAILAGGGYQDGSLLANRLGLQLARIATLNTAFKLRKRPTDPDLKPLVATYERDGCVLIEDFLPDDVFEQVRAESLAAYDAGLFSSEVA